MEALIQINEQLLDSTDLTFKRYLYFTINWNNRLIAITGARGVGKTTIMLQYIKENQSRQKMIYVSAEHLYFSLHTLLDFADEFYKFGGKMIFIDEIHQYPNWAREIKVIYDSYPKLKIVFSGSSILEINKGNADLSRRVVPYILHGMSFREYLQLTTEQNFRVLKFKEVLEGEKIKLELPLVKFKSYLKQGYYPFMLENDYAVRLNGIINKVIEIDLVKFFDLKPHTGEKLKRLLSLIAQSVPFKPNMVKLSELIDVSRTLLPEYFNYLEKVGLIRQVNSFGKSLRSLGKADKVYLHNTNLNYALGQNPETGNIRETFFISQLAVLYDLYIPPAGDFIVEGNVFEIGGKNKTATQLKGIKKSYVVKDEIEYAAGNTIPLWHFGFLY